MKAEQRRLMQLKRRLQRLAERQRMVDIHVKLVTDQELTQDDRKWIAWILGQLEKGDDVRLLFPKKEPGRTRMEDLHFFMALDYFLHLGQGGDAAEKVANRWPNRKGESRNVAAVKRIAAQQRVNLKEVFGIDGNNIDDSRRAELTALVEMRRQR